MRTVLIAFTLLTAVTTMAEARDGSTRNTQREFQKIISSESDHDVPSPTGKQHADCEGQPQATVFQQSAVSRLIQPSRTMAGPQCPISQGSDHSPEQETGP